MGCLIVYEPCHGGVFQIMKTVAQMNGILNKWIIDFNGFAEGNLVFEELTKPCLIGGLLVQNTNLRQRMIANHTIDI